MRTEKKMRVNARRFRARNVIIAILALLVVGASSGVAAAFSHASKFRPPAVLDRIPAHMLPASTPIPISPEIIKVSNAWLLSDGVTLVAVYAGTAGNDPSMGRFVLVRQNTTTGRQTIDAVNVVDSGALSIVKAPTGAAVETSAQRAHLLFRSAHGISGALDLANDTITRN
jgi:hypothetical protein